MKVSEGFPFRCAIPQPMIVQVNCSPAQLIRFPVCGGICFVVHTEIMSVSLLARRRSFLYLQEVSAARRVRRRALRPQ